MPSAPKKTILLADHSKFNRSSLSLSLEMKQISTIIPDNKAPAAILERFRESGSHRRLSALPH
jgi:DeoR/GlpR family transcriptional regulator of sugar metabolism